MTLNWTYTGSMTAMAAHTALLLCPAAALAQSANPWNPYPVQQTRPAPTPVPPAPKPKYYQEPAAPAAALKIAPPSPSRFAPPDLAQRLSAPPLGPQNRRQNALPYGYQAPAMPPYAASPPNSQAYFGQPQSYANGYPPNYPMNAPPNSGGYGYGGYGPPIIGNNSWGGGPGNNFFPFGF